MAAAADRRRPAAADAHPDTPDAALPAAEAAAPPDARRALPAAQRRWAAPMPARVPNGPVKSTRFKKLAAAGTIATMAI